MTIGSDARSARIGVLLILAALAFATLIPLWRDTGWPTNHDNAFGLRTAIYARHFSELDLLPIWSSADVHGYGSPAPLMYHKLFFMAAGLLAVAGTSIKTADVTTVWLFLVVGALGTYRTVRLLGGSRLAATIGGGALVTANYTVTNWLVRGALAEFSAAMVTAWALFFFVQSLQSGRVELGLGLALGLLWLAHSVLAFYVGLLMAVTYLVLAVAGVARWSLLRPRTLARPLAAFVLLVGPYLAAMAILSQPYAFDRILIPYRPHNEFREWPAYLWEQHWRFGRTASGLTVQLDHPVLALLIVSLGSLVFRSPSATRPRWAMLHPVLPLLLLAAGGIVLQLPVSGPFYQWMPGAAYLQFPWRLLALITPCLIVSAIVLADRALPADGRLFGLGLVAAWMVAGSGAFAPLQDPRIAIDPPLLTAISFSSPYREYEPRTAPPIAETGARLAARWSETGCSYDRAGGSQETTMVRFATTCGRAATLPLPLYASRLHLVGTPNGGSQPCLTLPEFPDLCGAVIPSGSGRVSVALPRMASLAWRWWRQRQARWGR